MALLFRYIRDKSGATAIEYALIATGVAVTIAATVFLLGDTMVDVYQLVIDTIAGYI